MKKTLAIIIGIQGSGKSTFYRKYLANDYVRVNLDTLVTREREWTLVEECIKQGKSFAIDNTNPTWYVRAKYILYALYNGYRIVGYYFDSDLQECIKRNNLRVGKERIPEEAIHKTLSKLQKPDYKEGFDELYLVTNDGDNMTISKWIDD